LITRHLDKSGPKGQHFAVAGTKIGTGGERLMTRLLLLALAMLAAMATNAAPASAQTSQVRCESRNYQPNSCPAYNARDVRITNQLGGSCRPGADWNFDGRNINVRNGCRAVFAVYLYDYGGGYPGGGYPGGGYQGNAQLIRCESQDYRTTRCGANTRGGVQLQRQLGNSACVQGRSWGWDRSGIWVSNGCRGDFMVLAGGGGNWGGGSGGNWGGGSGGNWGGDGGVRTIDCNSRNYQPERCRVDVRNDVRIDRVNGGECIQGRSWGWDRGGIWVNNGCRARFRVY
jgi:hypothetical protein